MTARLYKVYCYRGKQKQVWFEAEDVSTGQGIAWSPNKATCLEKIARLSYELENETPILKFYRARTR